jgi:hypothetical protein
MSKEYIVQTIDHLNVIQVANKASKYRASTVATVSVDGVMLKQVVIQGEVVPADGATEGAFRTADKHSLVGWRDPRTGELIVIRGKQTLLATCVGGASVCVLAAFWLADSFYFPFILAWNRLIEDGGVWGVLLGDPRIYAYGAICIVIICCLLLGSDKGRREALERLLPKPDQTKANQQPE